MNPRESIRSLLFGLSLPLRSARLILSSPALLGASVVPWLLSVILDAWLVHWLQRLLGDWIHDHASGSFEWLAQVLAWAVVVIAGVLAFSFIAGVAALPFNDWLAELTEPRAEPALAHTGKTTWLGKARLLSIDLFKTLCALALSLMALVLTWVPGLNLLGVVLAFLLIAFQFLSYPQTRRGEGVVAGIRFLFAHFWSCAGFGASFAFLFALPFISSLALPLAVVGGTLLYARGAPEKHRAAKAAH